MIDARFPKARAFADTHGWNGADMRLIAGDASNRKYYRLTKSDQTALVMDAPPDKGEDTRPFCQIARWLAQSGFSAPRIFAEDARHGFLLIEDFGDALFARRIEAGQDETPLYEAATDVLCVLTKQPPPPDLAPYDAKTMADMAALSVTWYRAGVVGQADPVAENELRARFLDLLKPLDKDLTCLIQRDYHAENLIWLPQRVGIQRVGLLDFQDAMRGHPAYDLVSVLQDARRDVPRALAETMLERFVARTGTEPASFRRAFTLLGLQRNLRILGVFARLCIRDGKPGYLPLIPRVWDHILYNLTSLEDAELTTFLRSTLPDPTQANLELIAAACPAASQP